MVMNSIKLAKNISIIILVFLLAMNAYFFYKNGERQEEFKAVAAENQDLTEQNKSLKNEQENISNTAREQRFDDLLSQAKLFTNLVYVQKVDGYQKRKQEAKGVMNKELLERYYPADKFNQSDIESKLIEDKYYIENTDMGQEKVDILIEVTHEIDYKDTGKKDESHMFLRVNFSLDDGTWKAQSVEDLFSNTEEVQEEKSEVKDV